MIKEKITRNLRARIRKSKNDINKIKKNFFDWIKGAELVELKECEIEKDPVRPELTLGWRITKGRKIYGLKYQDEIEGIICIAYTNEVPHSVKELDMMSELVHMKKEQPKIAIA